MTLPNNTLKGTFHYLYQALFIAIILLPLHLTLAVDYQTMVSIPGVTDTGSLTFGSYVNILYNLAIVGAALLAVIQLVLAGAMYMASDANVSSKGVAIAKIQGALVGLLIIISAYIILNEINDQLLELEPFTNIVPTNVTGVNMMDGRTPSSAPVPSSVTGGRGGEQSLIDSCDSVGTVQVRGSGRNRRMACCTSGSTDIACTSGTPINNLDDDEQNTFEVFPDTGENIYGTSRAVYRTTDERDTAVRNCPGTADTVTLRAGRYEVMCTYHIAGTGSGPI